MFWADRIVEEIKTQYGEKIKSGKSLIIRDEKTASGRIHVGSLRGVAIHGIISEILTERNVENQFLYEINDFDPMDSVPIYLDRKKYLPHMGKPLCDIPSPDGKAKNYAEYYGEEFISVIKSLGFKPEFYRSSDMYKTGKFNGAIKIALENADKIREIYERVSGGKREAGWLPLNVVCEKCGKFSTTRAKNFDGETVEYSCEENLVEWARGCSHRGKISPFDGNAKLPWKVEWAAKFFVFGVDIEGAGKDLGTKGGARDVAGTISSEIFKYKPPFDIFYEHFVVKGKKMSASKGAGSSAKEIADLLPAEMLRYLLLGKEPNKVIDFVPDGDTIPILYDNFDKMASYYFSKEESDYKRIFFISYPPEQRGSIEKKFLPRFSQIAFLVQMPHIGTEEAVKEMKGDKLTADDRKEIKYREKYALGWLREYAPGDYKYELKEKGVPEVAKNFSDEQKNSLKLLLEYVKSKGKLDGQELHTKIHEIKKETGIKPADFFGAIYLSFLGKDHGPKAGWFLSVLDKKFLEKRLEEVTSQSVKQSSFRR